MPRDWTNDPPQPKPPMKIVTPVERVQPTVIGIDDRGEFIWEGREMAYWQMAMLPLRYLGDFAAHWHRVKLLFEHGIEGDNGVSADFQSYVPWQLEEKYAQKRRHHKGD